MRVIAMHVSLWSYTVYCVIAVSVCVNYAEFAYT